MGFIKLSQGKRKESARPMHYVTPITSVRSLQPPSSNRFLLVCSVLLLIVITTIYCTGIFANFIKHSRHSILVSRYFALYIKIIILVCKKWKYRNCCILISSVMTFSNILMIFYGFPGYANAKIYKCDNKKCPRPTCYTSGGSSKDDSFPCYRPACTGRFQLVRHVSFVDCPGHDILMATMLNGAAVMDAALLLIAGNEPCPQPQTSEHLAAIEIMKLKHIIILQNKIDLVNDAKAREQYDEIIKFVQGTVAEGAPIIPISAQLKYNIEVRIFKVLYFYSR